MVQFFKFSLAVCKDFERSSLKTCIERMGYDDGKSDLIVNNNSMLMFILWICMFWPSICSLENNFLFLPKSAPASQDPGADFVLGPGIAI